LKRTGRKEISGADWNEKLPRIARTTDVSLVESDMWEHLKSESLQVAVYFYLDVIEHVSVVGESGVITMPPARQLVDGELAANRRIQHDTCGEPNVSRVQLLGLYHII
jgi:hypothetical protein